MQMERRGCILVCYGTSVDVKPSGMSLDMGHGDMAYKHTMGEPALRKDMVYIFDTGPDVKPVTIEEQNAYYELWFRTPKAYKSS